MDESIFEFESELWLYPGVGGWFFLTLPSHVADEIDEAGGERAGFGSIPVEVTIGDTTWKTSLFPDKKTTSFVLPVKKAIRAKEGLDQHSMVAVHLRLDPDRR